jgi:replicative DNA helicase
LSSRDVVRNEQNFLGCLLRSPHVYWQINDVVKPDMFTVVHHREIYAAVIDVSEGGRKLSTAALLAHLPEEYDPAGPTVGILATLKENAIEAGSAADYAPFLAEQSAKSKLEALSGWIKKAVSAGDKNMEDVATDAAARLQEIMANASPLRPVKLSEITKRVVSFSERARDKEIMPGFTTGLHGLDEMTGLLMGGDFIGVIGALGDGKSAVLAQVGKHIARSAPVLSCHNEMSEEQNGTRAVAGEAGLSVREVREGAYDFMGADAVKAAQGRIEGLKYHIYTDPRMTVRGIRTRALQMKRTIGLGAITIDAMKRLRTDIKTRDKWERMEEITGELKAMAIEFGVPVLLAVHRTRAARRRDDPIPQLDDAEAPSLEGDADIVIGVWRPEAWLMMNKPNAKAGGEAWEKWEHEIQRARGVGKMIGLKVRSGAPFEQREFRFNGAATRFEDL